MCQSISEHASNFLSGLADLKKQTQFSLDDRERFNFNFVPLPRKGPTFHDLSEKQKTAGLALLRASLGKQGYEKATAIVELEKVLKALENRESNDLYRDPLNYHFLVFGNPADPSWAWKFEGHHVSLNFAVSGNEIVSSTPSFLGSNPGIVPRGEEKGKQILKLETELAFSLINSMAADQMKAARFSENALAEIVTGNDLKPRSLKPEGISYRSLNDAQKKIFLELLGVYVKNYEFGFSNRLMDKITKAGVDNLTFGWAGSLVPGGGHYYRIQGTMLLIEYDNTQNNANHVHTVVRDLTNDFAEDILREHYLKDHLR